MAAKLHIVVVTGMSGAGRTSALRVLEDLGFFCVDNLPPKLAPAVVREVMAPPAPPPRGSTAPPAMPLERIGFGVDVRTGSFLEGAGQALDELAASGHDVEVLFLDCADDALVRRYSETRRPHPLAPAGDVLEAIGRERERLAPLRVRAKHVIDTSRLSVHDLRRTLVEHIAREGERPQMRIRFVSFGFKFGLPVDADLVFDVRYLPNPHFVPELKPLTGLDAPVADYVLASSETRELIEDVSRLLERTLPRYEREGKAYLTVAIGCTGGRHRSVAIVEELARAFRTQRAVLVSHRDAGRPT